MYRKVVFNNNVYNNLREKEPILYFTDRWTPGPTNVQLSGMSPIYDLFTRNIEENII